MSSHNGQLSLRAPWKLEMLSSCRDSDSPQTSKHDGCGLLVCVSGSLARRSLDSRRFKSPEGLLSPGVAVSWSHDD